MEKTVEDLGILTTGQAAKKAGVTRTTIYAWIKREWLPSYKAGRHRFVKAEDVPKAIEQANAHRQKTGRGGLRLSDIKSGK